MNIVVIDSQGGGDRKTGRILPQDSLSISQGDRNRNERTSYATDGESRC